MGNFASFSKIIAGTMTWGSGGKRLSKSEMADLIHHCYDHGITTFDHADIYGGYTNETDFGNAFGPSDISRAKVQLITKCGIQYVCSARSNKVKHYDYSKAYIIGSAEASLKKLKTDYIDLFLLHRPSPLMDPEAIAEAITHLKKEGKIIEFGVSNFTPSQIKMVETAIPISGNQVEFSLTADTVMYNGILDDIITSRRLGMSWSPLGTYFKEENEKTLRIREVMGDLTQKYAATPDQILLAWGLKHPAKMYPVVGTTEKSRLKNALLATELDLELEDWFVLLGASQGHKVP